ncbi:MAG: DUF58 domain-containing protein [Alphaproteobacteria bacterium]
MSPSGNPRESLLDQAEHAASALPPLLVAAERIAATVASGLHGRRRAGPGETFWQFRRYQVGDEMRAIDWRQSAKRDRLYVREYEWEAAQSVWLWCDRSPSMNYHSGPELPEKRERAVLLTLALAALLVRGGERIALLEETWRDPPGVGRATLLRLAAGLSRSAPESPGFPVPVRLPRYANVVLIGDFLAPLAETSAFLLDLSGRGLRSHVLQVLDPAEETLPFSGRIRFSGLEGERETLIPRAEAAREAYGRRLAAHRQGLEDITRAARGTFATHRTNVAPELALLALYAALGPRGRNSGDRR